MTKTPIIFIKLYIHIYICIYAIHIYTYKCYSYIYIIHKDITIYRHAYSTDSVNTRKIGN